MWRRDLWKTSERPVQSFCESKIALKIALTYKFQFILFFVFLKNKNAGDKGWQAEYTAG